MISKDDMLPDSFLKEEEDNQETPNLTSTFTSQQAVPSASNSSSPRDALTPASSNSKRQRKPYPRENIRKRSRNLSKWKNNVAKEAYNAGIQHVLPRGFERKARKLSEGEGEEYSHG